MSDPNSPEGTEQIDEQPIAAPEPTENPTEEIVETPAPEPTPEQPSEEPAPQDEPDYKEKFKESGKESILNAERVKVKEAQLEELTKTDTPTDEVMRKLYPDWDDLNDVTQRAFVNQEIQSIKQRKIELQQNEIIARQKLDDELETVIDDNPKLVGKEAEFKRFAKNPKNKGINAETLAKAFLFDVEEATPPKPSEDAPREALPQGNGGPRDPIKPKKISIEESIQIKNTDYKRYMELVQSGAIEEIDESI